LNPNRQALEALITKPEVERKLLQRLRKKAETYAQDFTADSSTHGHATPTDINGQVANGATIQNKSGPYSGKIDIDSVVDLYESFIIPLTKEVEVSAAFLSSASSLNDCNCN
jgi:chorismate mutase